MDLRDMVGCNGCLLGCNGCFIRLRFLLTLHIACNVLLDFCTSGCIGIKKIITTIYQRVHSS
jgi:hypothetical protein